MRKQLLINVNNKIASLVDKEQFIVCGNTDYDVRFEFSEEWQSESVKTALFVFDNTAVEKVFTGDTCEGIEIQNSAVCAIGVYTGNIITTTPAYVNCKKSIRDIANSKTHDAPSEDVYNEIIKITNDFIAEVKTRIESVELKTYYDHVINTVGELVTLENLSGRILIRDVAINNSIALTVSENISSITLYNVVISDTATFDLAGHWYCSINCIGEQKGNFILRDFKGVKDFNVDEGLLKLYGCHSISNCTISTAENCYHIDNCCAVSDDPTFYNCHFICGISFTDNTEGTVEFDFCSYLSNIDCEGRYVECTFVDDTTCKGFVSPEDVGKVRAITADGSYVPIVPAQGGGGGGGENAPTKVSELENDAGYITSEEAPVQSVNGEKGAVSLTAEDIGADKSGAAVAKVAEHNVDNESHKDVRLLIAGLADRLNTLANSDDTTLDQMKEVVDYIKSNRGLIEQITTNKISYTDIIDNLTTNAAKKPLSAAQGVALKALIDAIIVPKKVSELTNDKGYLTSYTESDPTVPSWAKQPSKPSYTKTEVGLGNVDNVRQYSAENPPPYPVQSVNGKTGEIALNASDVGARPNTWVPTAAEVGARPNTWMPTYSEVGADKSGAASNAVSEHNVDDEAHNDIRLELKAIAERINAVLDSDDTTLDELSEIVAYIKSNKSLIELVTSTKVGYGDIVDNLTTNSTKNALSANQGVILKRLIDALANDKLDASALPTAIDTALAQAKESGEFDGADGERGNGILNITTAPSSYTTTTGGFTPVYRIALSTVISQSKVSEVLVGDTLAYSFYHYPVGYVDSSYVYLETRKNIRGATGAAGTNGTSITITSVNESDESGGTNTVTFSDRKTLTVKNGKNGQDGYTPIKGIDYFTPTDKTELENGLASKIITQEAGESESLVMSQKAVTNLVADALGSGGGVSSQYETVDSVDEMTDITKQYVLSGTGTLWAYGETTVDDTNRNLYDATKVALNQNPDGSTRNGAFVTDYIPVDITYADPYKMHVVGLDWQNLAEFPEVYKVAYYNASKTQLGLPYMHQVSIESDGREDNRGQYLKVGYNSSGAKESYYTNIAYVRLLCRASETSITQTNVPTDITITTPEPKITVGEGWYDTEVTPSTGGGNYVELLVKVNKNTTDIAKVAERVTAIEAKGNVVTIPRYWEDAAEAVVSMVKARQNVGGKDIVNFAWFSDLHYDGATTDYIGNVGNLCAYIMNSCDIPLALMSGDTLTAGIKTTDSEVINALNGAMELYAPIGTDRLMLVRGNHDDVYGENGGVYYVNKVNPSKIWNSLHRPQAKDFRRVFGEDGTYFYLDNTPQKVRFICLNSQFYEGKAITNGTTNAMTTQFGTTQLEWLENIALNVEDEWGVVISFHTPPIADFASQFSGNDYADFRRIITNSTADIIGIFCGHAHKDRIISGDLKCPVCVITCAFNTPYDGTASDRVAGTTTETALDIVSIDKANRKIYMTRLGAGSDREIDY